MYLGLHVAACIHRDALILNAVSNTLHVIDLKTFLFSEPLLPKHAIEPFNPTLVSEVMLWRARRRRLINASIGHVGLQML